MFFFVLFANLFAFLPGAGAVKYGDATLFRSVMADYSIVLMLTMVTVITVQIVAIITNGPFGYLKKFINFSSPLNFVLGLMEIVSELAKILSLSFRLFGNIFAGEVLGAVMLFLMPYFLPLPFMFLGLLSAVIQAFVFSLLTTIFITMASELPAPETPVVT
jgi:F-type H+-transporting ATPase subunit a